MAVMGELSPEIKKMMDNLEASTGKKLDDWFRIIDSCGLQKHGEVVNHLKSTHGIGHGYANMLLHVKKLAVEGSPEDDDLIKKQYEGKEALKVWYDRLEQTIKGFGDDVEISAKQAYVSFRTKKQFALIQPSTKTRLDIGLNAKGMAPDDTAIASGSWNAMCTHRIKIESEEQLNDTVIAWLKKAYEGVK